jgi:hypothetical protein
MNYETFLLDRQLPWVAKTLPQDSADTSNTGSNRKEGALYCFLMGEGVASRGLSLVELSVFS